MKKILFVLTVLALVFPALPRADADEVTVEAFYNNLSGGGWIDVDDYGYGWQPDVAVSDPDWRPYADGYWAYTDYGWTWISYEDFGWATYHYGRWARLADYGWVWFPGNDLEWGPAWVSWRRGGNYAGWAPLPPRGPGVVYEGQPIGSRVDVEFDIGPAYYNFIDVRYIGEPVLRSHIYASNSNVAYVNQTVNVTNITVKNKVVYNYGPDIEVLSRHSERPIQRLKIERQEGVDFSAAARSGGLTKVQGDRLVLGAPQNIRRSSTQLAPPTIKTKVTKERVKLDRGWSGAGDEKAQFQLKQKMKTEDPKKIPPPTAIGALGATGPMGGTGSLGTTGSMGARGEKGQMGVSGRMGATGSMGTTGRMGASGSMGTTGETGASGRMGATGSMGTTGRMGTTDRMGTSGAMGTTGSMGAPVPTPTGGSTPMGTPLPEPGRRKDRLSEPPTTPSVSAGTTSIEGSDSIRGAGKNRGRQGKSMQPEFPSSTGAPTGAPENSSRLIRHPKPADQGYPGPTSAGPSGSLGESANTTERLGGKHKIKPIETAPPDQTSTSEMGTERGKGRKQQMGGGQPTGLEPMNPPGGGKQKGRAQTTDPAEPATSAAPGAPGQPGQGRLEKGRKPKDEASPVPTP
ncbi:MAG: DUF6600 domain-containing protein [Verrucomicrobiota bacterium]